MKFRLEDFVTWEGEGTGAPAAAPPPAAEAPTPPAAPEGAAPQGDTRELDDGSMKFVLEAFDPMTSDLNEEDILELQAQVPPTPAVPEAQPQVAAPPEQTLTAPQPAAAAPPVQPTPPPAPVVAAPAVAQPAQAPMQTPQPAAP